MVWPKTYVNGFTFTIKIEPIEGRVYNNPLCHFQHIFIFNYKIHRRTQPYRLQINYNHNVPTSVRVPKKRSKDYL